MPDEHIQPTHRPEVPPADGPKRERQISRASEERPMKELTERDIQIAKQIYAKQLGTDVISDIEIARIYKCSSKTIYRMRKDPRIMEFIGNLKTELDRKISAKHDSYAETIAGAGIEVLWNFNESARKLKIIVETSDRDSDRISAIKLLNEMYGVAKVPSKPASEDAPNPAGPDVYRASWMTETKQ